MKKYYSMETNGRTADVYIFGDIVDAFETGLNQAWGLDGLGEVSGLSIANEIKHLDVDTINVHINSCGGYTSEGLAIYNTLKIIRRTLLPIVTDLLVLPRRLSSWRAMTESCAVLLR